jgi:glycosyltransferase involved in cell wall biosynthesis
VIVGDGPEKQRLAELASQLGITDHVVFTGERSATETYYRAFDLYVSPSRTEGISNTILEALASGVPVVASAVGGTPELLSKAGSAAVAVPPEAPELLAAAITRCLESEQELDMRRDAACEVARKYFSLSRMVQAYEALYREIGECRERPT